MKRAITCLAAVCAVAVAIAGCGRTERRAAATARPPVRLLTGTPGGGFYPIGAGLESTFGRSATSLRLDHRESAGSIANVTALERGEADAALAYADVAYLAFTGGLESAQQQRFTNLRGIAVLQLAPVHLVAAPGSRIRSVADLRGRRVGLGTAGSGTTLTAGLILRAFGIGSSSIRAESLRYDQAAARLAAGELDAMFVIGSDPVDAVRVALAGGGVLVPLTGAPIEQLRREYPFFHPAVVRRGSYPGQREGVQTIAVENLLLCRATLPEAVVYEFTARLFEVQPAVAPLAGMDLANAPAVPIPLHDGAARFYREREIFR